MTVAELVAELLKQPQDMKCIVQHDCYYSRPVTGVAIHESYKEPDTVMIMVDD